MKPINENENKEINIIVEEDKKVEGENIEPNAEKEIEVEKKDIDLKAELEKAKAEIEARDANLAKLKNTNKSLVEANNEIDTIAKHLNVDRQTAISIFKENLIREQAQEEGVSKEVKEREYSINSRIERQEKNLKENQSRLITYDLIQNFAGVTPKKAEMFLDSAKLVFGKGIVDQEHEDITNYIKGKFDLKPKSAIVNNTKKIENKNENKSTPAPKQNTTGVPKVHIKDNSNEIKDGSTLTPEDRETLKIITIEDHIRSERDNGETLAEVLRTTKRIFPEWANLIDSGKVKF